MENLCKEGIKYLSGESLTSISQTWQVQKLCSIIKKHQFLGAHSSFIRK